uniref:Putative glycine rich protein n=1 Tax=Ixodes ricinus TaxID=34613 RepID=A0A0K8R3U4_IXORI
MKAVLSLAVICTRSHRRRCWWLRRLRPRRPRFWRLRWLRPRWSRRLRRLRPRWTRRLRARLWWSLWRKLRRKLRWTLWWPLRRPRRRILWLISSSDLFYTLLFSRDLQHSGPSRNQTKRTIIRF